MAEQLRYRIAFFWHRLKKRTVRTVRRFLRYCYRLGLPTCLFCAGVLVFVIVAVVLLITVPAKRKKAAAEAAETAEIAVSVQTQSTPAPGQSGSKPSGQGTTEEVITGTYTESENPGQTGEVRQEASSVTPEPTAAPEPTQKIQYQKYDKGPEIAELQQRLMDLGYLDADEPTEKFGTAMKEAVQYFQRQHGLQADGIIGNVTYDLLMSKKAKPYVMFEGAEGNDIRDFQEMLYDLGYLEKKQITGYYGSETVTAVKTFQKRNKLSQDGKAGEKTIETINSDKAKPSALKLKEIEEEKKKAAAEAAKKTAEYRIDEMIKVAEDQLGKPYILGDRGPNSFDCSGLVYYCLRKVHVYTTRMNAAGFSKVSSWQKIDSLSKLKRGDLIFFRSGSSKTVSHVGIYVGHGMMIDASTSEGKVVKRSCTGKWSKTNFVCGRRPIS